MPLPESGRVMGHEGTGTIDRLGAGVTTDSLGTPIREGDRVIYLRDHALRPLLPVPPRRGELVWRKQPVPRGGRVPVLHGHVRRLLLDPPRSSVFRVPDELPDSVLGWVNCAMGTVTEGLLRAGAKEGDYVLIQGAGGLGLNATAMAKEMGAHRVIVLDRLADRLKLAEEFGADHTNRHHRVRDARGAPRAGARSDRGPRRQHRDGARRQGGAARRGRELT